MSTKAMIKTIRIGRKEVDCNLAFIYQDYTMLPCSPKQIIYINDKGVINRRGFVGQPLQFFTKKMLGAGKNCKANQEYGSGGNKGS
jgi:hypothetical protein